MDKPHTAKKRKIAPLTLAIFACISSAAIHAQSTNNATGIRSSLSGALHSKQASNNIVDTIQFEDIGALPNQNLAEALENIAGIQISRTAGVGSDVYVRGMNTNRVEINGVATMSSDGNRGGIDFNDIATAMFTSVEIIKSPEAKTIEGSAGGTINLKTVRPLELTETLGAIQLQGENDSLSADSGFTPRISGHYGDNWETDAGTFGLVLNASYAEQDVTAFRPRVDRDNLITADSGAASAQSFDFLPIQFLVQDYDNYEYETSNFAGSFEWAPNDSLKLYVDAAIYQQEQRQKSSRIQASGVSILSETSTPSEFESIEFGAINGENGSQELGHIQAARQGVFAVDPADELDPNLRTSSDTNSRLTDSEIFSIGGEWSAGKLSGRVELSTSESDTQTPYLNTTLNFINPNVATGSSNDNGTPFEYDLSGGTLSFGIATGEANAPSTEQRLDPANYVLRDIEVALDSAKNTENAFRSDFTFTVDTAGISTIDFGYRYSDVSSTNNDVRTNSAFRTMAESPAGDSFTSLLAAGPDNYNAADGRTLFISDYLLIDPEQVATDLNGTLATLRAATATHQTTTGDFYPVGEPTLEANTFFDITEETQALYVQANFAAGIFHGNAGLRYLTTDVDAHGLVTANDEPVASNSHGSYSAVLPRINFAANVTDDLILRAAWSQDITRANFDMLSESREFNTSPNIPVTMGNTHLQPEEVESYDISAQWYFSPSSMISINYFHKTRSAVFESKFTEASVDSNGYRDTTAPCENGGIFNPIAGSSSSLFENGYCVSSIQPANGDNEITLKGFEFAFQYDLSELENTLGWASGFGVQANYTKQEASGGDALFSSSDRAGEVFAATSELTNVTLQHSLLELSENTYNITAYYEKFGVSAKVGYTWRDAYRTQDLGSTSTHPWGFPVVQEDRGQLNASLYYNLTKGLNIGLTAINLTESEVEQSCINSGALNCYQGFTGRRISLGANYTF